MLMARGIFLDVDLIWCKLSIWHAKSARITPSSHHPYCRLIVPNRFKSNKKAETWPVSAF
jgi:hypothetical protein